MLPRAGRLIQTLLLPGQSKIQSGRQGLRPRPGRTLHQSSKPGPGNNRLRRSRLSQVPHQVLLQPVGRKRLPSRKNLPSRYTTLRMIRLQICKNGSCVCRPILKISAAATLRNGKSFLPL